MASILDHHFDRRHGKVLPDGAPHVQHDHLGNQGRGPRPAGGCIPFRKGGEQKPVRLYNLVGGWPTPLKNNKVSWDYNPQYMEN